MNETKTEWRDCADPDELAAAVAAGVEVQWERYDGWVPTANQTADQFAGSLRAGITYRIPSSWSWRPEPPAPDEVVAPDDDEPCATNPCEACRGRAVRATDECTRSPDRVGSPAGNDHPVTIPPADDLRERAHEVGFAESRYAFQQHMPAGKNRHQHVAEERIVTDDGFLHLGLEVGE